MKKQFFSLFLTALVMTVALITPNQSVLAKDKDVYIAEGFKNQGELTNFLDENYVPKDKQKILIDKLNANQLWDCYNPDKVKEVPQDFNKFKPEDGTQVRYYRFEDGSFIKLGATLNDDIPLDNKPENISKLKNKIKDKNLLDKMLQTTPQIQTFGYQSGSGYAHYWDYKVEKYVGLCHAWFTAEFVTVQEGADYLIQSGCFDPQVENFGELLGYPTLNMIRTTEDVYLSRYALVQSSWATSTSVSTKWTGTLTVSSTFSLYLAVGGNSFYIDSKLPY